MMLPILLDIWSLDLFNIYFLFSLIYFSFLNLGLGLE